MLSESPSLLVVRHHERRLQLQQALWKEPGEKGAAASDKTLCPKSGKSLPRRDATLPRAMGGPTNKL